MAGGIGKTGGPGSMKPAFGGQPARAKRLEEHSTLMQMLEKLAYRIQTGHSWSAEGKTQRAADVAEHAKLSAKLKEIDDD